jgi:tRNA A37 threonylcarbamoyladenosine biosynthesis protein TsaE
MHYDLYRIKNIKELSQLGIFNENVNSIKIIEWPQLIESNAIDRLELHFSYVSNENERKLISKGSGKWKVFNLDEL